MQIGRAEDPWLSLADQAWKGLRDEKESPTRLLAGQLIAHRASLVANGSESQSCWREYEDWLRRDSFASARDPYVGREYIEANIRYLNRIEPTPICHSISFALTNSWMNSKISSRRC